MSLLSANSLRADQFVLDAGSTMTSGCGAPCACAVVFSVGDVTGGFRLEPVPFSLGPVLEFFVVDVDLVVHATTGDQLVTGSGSYVIDLGALSQEMMLDLEIDGSPAQFLSFGAVPVDVTFPDYVYLDVFQVISGCWYDGLAIRSHRVGGFNRGDCNADAGFDIADAIGALSHLFQPGAPPASCEDACDSNDDGLFDIADAIFTLSALFVPGAQLPPPPFGSCDADPTGDALTCGVTGSCP
ncbi:MAG: hypothetical protein ACKVX7_15475 [Planctomycetota bacterium]